MAQRNLRSRKPAPVWDMSAQELAAVGRSAGRDAVAASKARGLAVTSVDRGAVVREWPDGRRETIKRLAGERPPVRVADTEIER